MVNLELALADLDVVNKRREKISGTARLKPGAKEKEELELLDRWPLTSMRASRFAR